MLGAPTFQSHDLEIATEYKDRVFLSLERSSAATSCERADAWESALQLLGAMEARLSVRAKGRCFATSFSFSLQWPWRVDHFGEAQRYIAGPSNRCGQPKAKREKTHMGENTLLRLKIISGRRHQDPLEGTFAAKTHPKTKSHGLSKTTRKRLRRRHLSGRLQTSGEDTSQGTNTRAVRLGRRCFPQ